MPRDARALLYEILNAAAAIDRALTGKTLIAYRDDPDTQGMVERHFITVGEALRRIETLDPEASREFPRHAGLSISGMCWSMRMTRSITRSCGKPAAQTPGTAPREPAAG